MIENTIFDFTFDPRDYAKVHLPELIANAFNMSRSRARSLIDQGAVEIMETKNRPDKGEYDVIAKDIDGFVLRVGKRNFRRIISTDKIDSK